MKKSELRQMIKEELLKEAKYNDSPKSFRQSLSDLGDVLEYYNKSNIWFLTKNPGVKKSVKEMYDSYYKMMDSISNIDFGVTDFNKVKKWEE